MTHPNAEGKSVLCLKGSIELNGEFSCCRVTRDNSFFGVYESMLSR